MYKCASMLEEGDGVSINKEEAFKYYKMSAENGNESAMKKCELMSENEKNKLAG